MIYYTESEILNKVSTRNSDGTMTLNTTPKTRDISTENYTLSTPINLNIEKGFNFSVKRITIKFDTQVSGDISIYSVDSFGNNIISFQETLTNNTTAIINNDYDFIVYSTIGDSLLLTFTGTVANAEIQIITETVN